MGANAATAQAANELSAASIDTPPPIAPSLYCPSLAGEGARNEREGFRTAVSIWRCKKRPVLKKLGLPAVEPPEPPRRSRNLLCLRHYFVSDVMLLQQVTRDKLGGPGGLKLLVAGGVFAEGGEDDIAGKDAVGGGIAAGDGFAGIGVRSAGGGG